MLNQSEIKRIAKLTGLKPYQQEKHYIQTLILRSIYSQYSPVFKGGTALMFIIGLNRFSEDLDFTISEEINLRKMPNKIKSDLELFGITSRTKIINETQASFSFRISAEGPLFTKQIDQSFVRVEISHRGDLVLKPKTIFINPEYPDQLPFSVLIMAYSEILAEKFRAVITRNKARDLYDIWFLIKQNINTTINIINKKLEYYNVKFDIDQLLEAISAKKDQWSAELTPIVIGELPVFEEVKQKIFEAIKKLQRKNDEHKPF